MKWPVYNITGSLFNRKIGYHYQQVVKVPAPHLASEKVTNTVGTFLTDYNSSIKNLTEVLCLFTSHSPKSPKISIFLQKNTSIKISLE